MGLGNELAGWLRSRENLVAMLDKDKQGAPRIHPRRLPQSAGPGPRAIVYHKISDVTEGALSEVVKFATAVFQFDCYGPKPNQADDLLEMLKKQLDMLIAGGVVGNLRIEGVDHEGDRDLTDEPSDGSDNARFISSCDYTITYQRPTA